MVEEVTRLRTYLIGFILVISRCWMATAQTNPAGNADSMRHIQSGENLYAQKSTLQWVRKLTDKQNPTLKWVHKLTNKIMAPAKKESDAPAVATEPPANAYRTVEGHTITRIHIVRLKPFGTSVTDTVMHSVKWFDKAGNAIHVGTREFIIRNALLFEEGDTINRFKLADSERYLRSLRYIDDARVHVVLVSETEAEVIVIVQDVLPYSADAGTNFTSKANLALTNRNIVGVGVEVRAGAFVDTHKDRLTGYEAMLRMPNIGKSFTSFQADYLDQYENQRYGFTLVRDFYAPTTRYAGHLIFENVRTPISYYDPEGAYPEATEISIGYRYADLWLGRSFQIKNQPFDKLRKNITVSLGAQHIRFTDRPEDAQNVFYKFQNRTTLLWSLTYTQQAHYKTNLIYNFGRTEDIPYGYKLEIVGGKEINELYNRPYIGANASAGYSIVRFGYLSGAVSYGTFLRRTSDQGIVDLHLNYFTSLYRTGTFRHRSFLDVQYTRHIHFRFNDDLDISDDDGIPGFRNDSVLGQHRLNLSVEHTLFTPWHLYDFRIVLYAFNNLSWIGGDQTPIILSSLYSAFGVGVRVRNNRFIFSTLQFQLAYFPNIPEHSRFRYYRLSKETVLQPREFKPQSPNLLPRY